MADSLESDIAATVRAALAEDVGDGDATAALIPENRTATATVVSREYAVLCGRAWFDAVYAALSPQIRVSWNLDDGRRLEPGSVLCALHGPARALLTGERCALNLLQTLSGTATAAARYVETVSGTGVRILDTRKTLPGLRRAQKYAVRTGGGENHRMGLYDAILVKENHIIAAGSLRAAVAAALAQADGRPVEVEVEDLAQAGEALEAGAPRLLLDNFALEQLHEAVTLRDRVAPGATLEASGGVNLETVRAIAETGIDFISVGSITKDLRATDLSMRFALD